MRVLAIEYEADGGPGVFAEAAETAGVELTVWRRWESEAIDFDPEEFDALICLGGSMHPIGPPNEPSELTADRAALERALSDGKPVLGVCLGAELCTQAAGGSVEKLPGIEVGWTDIRLTDAGRRDPLIGPLGESFLGFEWHSYGCRPPEGSEILAVSDASPQAWRLGPRAWCIQFHAEVVLVDTLSWLDSWRKDPDAEASGLDPKLIASETRERIGRWNELGRSLAGRFFDLAARRT